MKLMAIAAILVAASLVACSPARHEAPARPAAPEKTAAPVSVEAASLPTLILDDGKKWSLDDHPRGMFADMKGSLTQADGSSAEGRMAAGRTLRTQVDELIQGCTMTGLGHEQLHLWLGALIPAAQALAGATDDATSSQRMQDVKRLLDLTDTYFE